MKGRVVVTGAHGFIGRNLCLRLREEGYDPAPIAHGAPDSKLLAALSDSTAVVHCAGVNRPTDDDEFVSGNVGMTDRICTVLGQYHLRLPVIFTSSIKAADDTPYGRSKRAAEDRLQAYGADCGAAIAVLRLPNVFGKWARPDYNSVVATFCHNICRGRPIEVHDPSVPLTLLYIDDLCAGILDLLARHGSFDVNIDIGPQYTSTVGALAETIAGFKSSRVTKTPGAVGTGLLRALHATYLSYLPPEEFSYPLEVQGDARGIFAEMLRTGDSGQFSFFTALPGVTRGGHYHHSKVEKFLVVAGKARFGFRDMDTGLMHELFTDDGAPQIVETVPGWVHDITNVGDDKMVVLLWANEAFDPEAPDTYAAAVQP
jgi:UDP-2-acetamido-2,6-beta-L-arabino-hexul-4-ose reductase